MRFQVLGPLRVLDAAGTEIGLGGVQPRLVLALLVASEGRVVPVDALVDALWADSPPASAQGTLQSYASRLRRSLAGGAALGFSAGGYRLEVEEDDVDFRRFERLADRAGRLLDARRLEEAHGVLAEAESLWRGRAFSGFEDVAHLRPQVERLEERRLTAREAANEALLGLGRHDLAIADLTELVERHPLRERLRGQLMLALYRSGRQADALRTYAEGTRRLVEELGLDPSPALQRLEERILAQDPGLELRPNGTSGPPPTSRSAPSSAAPTTGRHRAFAVPETRYARADDGTYLAYQSFGEGDTCLLGAPPIFSNIEVLWEHPEPARFLRSLASFCRFVHYDKRGQGMSDRVADVPTLEQRASDTRAVMDAAGVERVVLHGVSEGGSTAAMVAAAYPERVIALALFGAFARVPAAPDHPAGVAPEVLDAVTEEWVAGWGTPASSTVALAAPDREGDVPFLEWINRLERQSSTPSGFRAQLGWASELDVRAVLPAIAVPTLVMHRTDDRLVPVAQGRFLAERIPGARLVEYPGSEHMPYLGDYDDILADLEELVTGHRGDGRIDRVLATVLFTDVASSTAQAAALGDRRWHDLLDHHDAVAHACVDRHGGRVVKATGDGVLATFDGPARAIRCAIELVGAGASLGLELRAGLHTGEVELRGDDVAGIAVHIGARVADCAGAGEVLVSRTVKDLVAGSGLVFEDRGEHRLRGVEDDWRLFRVG